MQRDLIVSPANLKRWARELERSAISSKSEGLCQNIEEEVNQVVTVADVWGRFSQASVSDDPALDELLDTFSVRAAYNVRRSAIPVTPPLLWLLFWWGALLPSEPAGRYILVESCQKSLPAFPTLNGAGAQVGIYAIFIDCWAMIVGLSNSLRG